MISHSHPDLASIQVRIARVLADGRIGIIPNESSLPEPKLVLSSESEESVTCYYYIANEPDRVRIVAVKCVASPTAREKIVNAGNASLRCPAALLPLQNASIDPDVFIFDDGDWISKTLYRLKLLPNRHAMPSPEQIVSGRAGFSRVYRFRLRSSEPDSQPQTYLVKFDRPSRAMREWAAISELRRRPPVTQIVMPLLDNKQSDGAIVYPGFAPTAPSVVSLDTFLADQLASFEHITASLHLLRDFFRELYGDATQASSGELWRTRYKWLHENKIRLTELAAQVPWASDATVSIWRLPQNIVTGSIVNPIAALETRLNTDCGARWKGTIHGDLQATNVLVALDEHGSPKRLGIIDLEKLDNSQPTAEDLASVEADFIRSVFPVVGKRFYERCPQGELNDWLIRVLFVVLTRLSGFNNDLQSLSLDFDARACARYVAHFLFRLRDLARPFLRHHGTDHYDPKHYFHSLLFQYLNALSYPDVQKDMIQTRTLLLSAGLAEQTIQCLNRVEYEEGIKSFPKTWEELDPDFGGALDPFEDNSAEAVALRDAITEQCGEINFLVGSVRMDEDYYRKLTFRGRTPKDQAELAQAVENLIAETYRERVGLTSGRAASRRRTEESDEGESWPIISLDDRIKAKCSAESASPFRALLLIDEPGGGKSTTAKNIAYRVSNRTAPFENERRKAVYIRLHDWELSGQAAGNLSSYLEFHHPCHKLSSWPGKEYWEEALGDATSRNGNLFLVLDGLDELSSRRSFAAKLLDAVRKWASRGNVIIITCRTRSLGAYLNKLTGFEILRGNGMNPDQIKEFILKYPSPALDKHVLIHDLRSQPALLQLAPYPFLLDVICYLSSKEKSKVAECRSELIESAIEELIGDHLEKLVPPNGGELSVKTLTRVLARASLLLFLKGEEDRLYNRFCHADLETAVETGVQLQHAENLGVSAKDLTDYYIKTRLLNVPLQSDLSTKEIGGFCHGLFFEFLAAEGLALTIKPLPTGHEKWAVSADYLPKNWSPRELVAAKVFDSEWFEMLSFLPSRLENPRHFFEIVCEEPDDLSRRRATLVIRALGELSGKALKDTSIRRWAEPLAQCCWDVAATHWALGITKLAEPVIAEISSVARVFPCLLERLGRDLQSPSLQRRLDALAGLERVGMSAGNIPPVRERVLKALGDSNLSVRKSAAATLAKMGTFVLREVAQKLEDCEEWYEQASACEAIGQMGATALAFKDLQVEQKLIRLLTHQQSLVRASACEALGCLARDIVDPQSAIKGLIERASLPQGDPSVRAQACAALGSFGGIAAGSVDVLQALIASLGDPNHIVRASAARALGEVIAHTGLQRAYLVDGLKGLLKSTPEARASACHALGKLNPLSPEEAKTVPLLLEECIRDENLEVCRSASSAVAQLGIPSVDTKAIKRLIPLLASEDWQIRSCAVETVGNLSSALGNEGEHVFADLVTNLQDDRWYVRASSCEALGKLGVGIPQLVPKIISHLNGVLAPSDPSLADTEGYVSIKAIRALGKLACSKAAPPGTAEQLVGFLRAETWQVRVATCEAFGDIGHQAKRIQGVLEGLENCLQAEQWCVRANGCKTLRKMIDTESAWGFLKGLDAETAQALIEGIVATICDPQQPVRAEAAEAVAGLAGGGDLGFRFLLDVHRSVVLASNSKTLSFTFTFPKPTPPLFMLSLVVPS